MFRGSPAHFTLAPVLSVLSVLAVLTPPASAQLTQESRYNILHSVVAIEGGARIAMPLGSNGLELSETGEINREKLQKELQKNGQSVAPGRVVSITAIEFGDDSLEIELDGGGTKKKGILSRIQIGVGMGNGPSPQSQPKDEEQAKGSKITLKFAKKVPPDLSPDRLKDLLSPVLDFNKQSVARAGIDALPPEFKEAVLAKEARVGMDGNTVRLAMGAPTRTHREKTNGVDQEDWIYEGRGNRVTFVTFEGNVVVEIREYD